MRLLFAAVLRERRVDLARSVDPSPNQLSRCVEVLPSCGHETQSVRL